jgi:hypothetical protein
MPQVASGPDVREELFHSFFLGGFECSTHLRGDGKRLDLLASTRHDVFAREDYARLRGQGIRAARDGLRWHVIERRPGLYDWSSVVPMLRAAKETGTQVVWDLLHFGWPDELDVFGSEFVERFARFAGAFAKLHAAESGEDLWVAPLNEPSFLSFAAGERGFFYPFAHERGDEIKRQFIRAILAASAAVRDVVPGARLVHTDPIINIIADPRRPQDRMAAETYRQAMFAVWDAISGRALPELGGRPEYLDVLGLNYYIHNQWIHDGGLLLPSHPLHLPLRWMLREVGERYGRPMFISETGIEAEARPLWLRYVCREVRAALALGLPIEGICLYPIADHPGWDDDRHCPNGLWGYADDAGSRPIDPEYARELRTQQERFETVRVGGPGAEAETVEAAAALAADHELFDRMERRMFDSAAQAMGEAAERSRTPA